MKTVGPFACAVRRIDPLALITAEFARDVSEKWIITAPGLHSKHSD
jgi:hypothetical protein